MQEIKQDNTAKKEYLKDYKRHCDKIKSLEEQLESLRTSIESAKGQIITDMPRCRNQSDLSDSIVKLDNVVNKILKAVDERDCLRADIELKIAEMEDGIESQILHKRYIEFKDWEQICVDIGYGWSQTHYKHSKALGNLKVNV